MYRSKLRARQLREGATEIPAAGGGGPASIVPPAGPPSPEDQLGDAGKAALDRERASAREAARLKTVAEQRADTAEAELTKLQEASQSDAEKATAKAVAEATAAVTVAGNSRLVRAEVKAAAASAQFHDPGDAALLLSDKFAQVKVDKDGNVDEQAVKALVEDLAKSKPHLVKAGSGATPLPGQGHQQPTALSGAAAGKAEAERRFGKPQTT